MVTSSTGLIGIYLVHKYEYEKNNFDDNNESHSDSDNYDNVLMIE